MFVFQYFIAAFSEITAIQNRIHDVQNWLSEYFSEITTMLQVELQTLPNSLPDITVSELGSWICPDVNSWTKFLIVLHVTKVIKRKLSVWIEQLTVGNNDAIEGIVTSLKASRNFLHQLSKFVDSPEDFTEILNLFASIFIPISSRLY